MRRRSELLKFRFEDIRVSVSGEDEILLRHSKTDQNGLGRVIPISHALANQLNEWQQRIQECGYILRNINRAEAIGEKLSAESINGILKRLEKEAGALDSNLSGHSFRVGKSVDLIEAGASIAQIANQGGWNSEKIVMKYCRAWRPNFSDALS